MTTIVGMGFLCFTRLDPSWDSASGEKPAYLDLEWFQGYLAPVDKQGTKQGHDCTFMLAGWPANQPPQVHDCCRGHHHSIASTSSAIGTANHTPLSSSLPSSSSPTNQVDIDSIEKGMQYYDIRMQNIKTDEIIELKNVLRPVPSDLVRLCVDDSEGVTTATFTAPGVNTADLTIKECSFDPLRLLESSFGLDFAKKKFPSLSFDTQLRICLGVFKLQYTFSSGNNDEGNQDV
ncbi:hypothetical protein BDF19DRAFT_457586 [Syncephalis fuscata]|nr:hypothetical protein BDF19DRAFT_457586 [Syncephalis fuscata]